MMVDSDLRLAEEERVTGREVYKFVASLARDNRRAGLGTHQPHFHSRAWWFGRLRNRPTSRGSPAIAISSCVREPRLDLRFELEPWTNFSPPSVRNMFSWPPRKSAESWRTPRYPAEFIREQPLDPTQCHRSRLEHGVKKLEFLGSSCIYPKFAPQPMKEEYSSDRVRWSRQTSGTRSLRSPASSCARRTASSMVSSV